MIANHTHGPWEIGELTDKHGHVHLAVAPEGFKGAVALISPIEDVNSFDRGNAQLVAAAPELLDACRLALITFNETAGCDVISGRGNVSRQLREAIAKATGADHV